MTPAECLPGERRREIRERHLNGIEYVQVDLDARTLQVRLLGKATFRPSTANVLIEPSGTGGGRGRGARTAVLPVAIRVRRERDATRPDRLDVVLDRLGDRGEYTLRLVADPDTGEPLRGFDPRYATAGFSFLAACPGGGDCPGGAPCDCAGGCSNDSGCGCGCDATPAAGPAVPIDYLVKDYAGFRRLLLDRLSLVSPDWTDRQVADLGVTLVELLGYVADQLSYTQDAIATEAYLDTARLRTSIRRHLRLVGYRMHDGCNARAWVSLEVSEPGVLPAGSVRFITALPEFAGRPAVAQEQLRNVDPSRYQVFEPLPAADLAVRPAHNAIRFWTWDGEQCVLPVGTTSATLVDAWAGRTVARGRPRERVLDLYPGDLLVLEEVRGPRTGVPGDADPRHRQAVRLTAVRPGLDPVHDQPVLEVDWAAADGLTFAASLSAVTSPDCCLIEDLTVARGNVVLVAQGRTEPWCGRKPAVLTAPDAPAAEICCDGPGEPSARPVALRFAPLIGPRPLTRAAPFPDPARIAAAQAARLDELLAEILDDPAPADPGVASGAARLSRLAARAHTGRPLRGPAEGSGPDLGPASGALLQDPRSALAQLELHSAGEVWRVRPDLLDSGPDDPDLVAEVDDEGASTLRFGDGRLGRAVEPGQQFSLRVRTGNGAGGNVPAAAIGHLVSCGSYPAGIASVRNPLPAAGGTDPEPVAEARRLGPTSSRFDPLVRAVVAEDYAKVVEGLLGVQDAAADLTWNGSWYEAQVALDPAGRLDVTRELLRLADARLHEVRRIGHDVQPVSADRVAVDATLEVCLLPGAHPDRIRVELSGRMGAGTGPDGPGLLHPDRLRFDSDLPGSRLIAAAMAVAGVRSARLLRLARGGGTGTPTDGVLTFGPLELPTAGELVITIVPEPANGR